jgi:chromosome segregation ATPase
MPGEKRLQIMATTLDELERRVAALERAAEREKAMERAVAEIVSDSERRLGTEMQSMRAEISGLRAEVKAETQRLDERIGASERRVVDTLNDRFDQVMAALDKLANPPR